MLLWLNASTSRVPIMGPVQEKDTSTRVNAMKKMLFLSLWIVLFVLLSLYLLGKLRFSHDSPSEHTPVSRFFLALASLACGRFLPLSLAEGELSCRQP